MTLALLRPSEADINKVMAETGMDRLQARRHVECRMYLQKVVSHPWGKSQTYMDEPAVKSYWIRPTR